jgi:hypothetical protein
MHQKKVISKTSLTNMSKSEKSAFFRHVFANNFFLVHFFKTFSTESISASKSPYFDTFFDFFKTFFFLGHISTFFELWLQMRRKWLKKTENLFLWMYLRIELCNHQTSKGLHNQVVKIVVPYNTIHFQNLEIKGLFYRLDPKKNLKEETKKL